MKMGEKICVAVFGICILAVAFAAAAGEVSVKKLNKFHWLKLETGNFVVVTDARERQAGEMVEELERFRYFMALLLGYKQKSLPHKVPVVLGRKDNTLETMGIPDNYEGLFVKNAHDEITIIASAEGFKTSDQGKGNRGRATVLHELVHQLIDNTSLGLAAPPWYNEGIAEYFSTYIEKDGKIILGDVSVVKNRFYSMLDRLGRPESVDTENLFKTGQEALGIADSMSREQEKFTDKFYARSFAVVHYLNADPGRRKQLLTYLYLLNKGFPVDESFEHAFDMEFAGLDDAVDSYINDRYMMARVFPVGEGGVEFPEVAYTAAVLEPREALEFLIPRIVMYSGTFLGPENLEKMYADVEAIYPDFFHRNAAGKP